MQWRGPIPVSAFWCALLWGDAATPEVRTGQKDKEPLEPLEFDERESRGLFQAMVTDMGNPPWINRGSGEFVKFDDWPTQTSMSRGIFDCHVWLPWFDCWRVPPFFLPFFGGAHDENLPQFCRSPFPRCPASPAEAWSDGRERVLKVSSGEIKINNDKHVYLSTHLSIYLYIYLSNSIYRLYIYKHDS